KACDIVTGRGRQDPAGGQISCGSLYRVTRGLTQAGTGIHCDYMLIERHILVEQGEHAVYADRTGKRDLSAGLVDRDIIKRTTILSQRLHKRSGEDQGGCAG